MGAGVTPGLGRCSAPGMFRAAGAAGRDARLADVHCCWARARLGPRRGPSAPRDREGDRAARRARGVRPRGRARPAGDLRAVCVDSRLSRLTCVTTSTHTRLPTHGTARPAAPTRRINRKLRRLGTNEGRSSAERGGRLFLSASPSLHLPALFRQPGSPHDQARRVRLSDALHQRIAGVLWAREGCRPRYGGAAGASCTFVFLRAGLLHARVHLMRRHHARLHHPWDRVGHTCVLLDDAVV